MPKTKRLKMPQAKSQERRLLERLLYSINHDARCYTLAVPHRAWDIDQVLARIESDVQAARKLLRSGND